MKQNLDWYDSFQNEITEIENTTHCPICGSSNIYNVNPYGYDFMCEKCCSTFEVHGKFENELLKISVEH